MKWKRSKKNFPSSAKPQDGQSNAGVAHDDAGEDFHDDADMSQLEEDSDIDVSDDQDVDIEQAEDDGERLTRPADITPYTDTQCAAVAGAFPLGPVHDMHAHASNYDMSESAVNARLNQLSNFSVENKLLSVTSSIS